MKPSEQRPLMRISPLTIAICEIFPAKLHMLKFNFMVLGLKVYCPSLFWGIFFKNRIRLIALWNFSFCAVSITRRSSRSNKQPSLTFHYAWADGHWFH